ncbi:hypothetical protein EDWATA_00112 [Edwardsiella tarda ATCC 23685]|uniref:Uncharacterized protein n=1 Tax=Edwardsiella tarda ATCC 23685 TaxID=500638 RepID=D4F089_EDWTA|nr:hypothetical protein EDWATA_00112 [Edwardsiella tarda ATCC 23685]
MLRRGLSRRDSHNHVMIIIISRYSTHIDSRFLLFLRESMG